MNFEWINRNIKNKINKKLKVYIKIATFFH